MYSCPLRGKCNVDALSLHMLSNLKDPWRVQSRGASVDLPPPSSLAHHHTHTHTWSWHSLPELGVHMSHMRSRKGCLGDTRVVPGRSCCKLLGASFPPTPATCGGLQLSPGLKLLNGSPVLIAPLGFWVSVKRRKRLLDTGLLSAILHEYEWT